MGVQTEVAFTLPIGVLDGEGGAHREGIMRLATARDELTALTTPEVRRNEAYLAVHLLARTVRFIGAIDRIDEQVIEELFAADFDHLQRLYERLNTDGDATVQVRCPHCSEDLDVELATAQDAALPK
ncbi:MAG: hypothetical protein PGN13_15325 [Patulibacter minatonensis]